MLKSLDLILQVVELIEGLSGCWTKALAVRISSTRCIKDVLLVISPIRKAKEKDVFLTVVNKNQPYFVMAFTLLN